MNQEQQSLQAQLAPLKQQLKKTRSDTPEYQHLLEQIEQVERQIKGTPPPPPSYPLRENPWCEGYLKKLSTKASYVPLAQIAPGIKDDLESPPTLDAIYTALLTSSPDEHRYLRAGNDAPDKRKSALEQVNDHQYLVLLGDPGSGKSTFVNFITLCLAGQWLQYKDVNLDLLTRPLNLDDDEERQKPQPWRHGPLLPVHVTLREFAAIGLPTDDAPVSADHLWQFLIKQLRNDGRAEFVEPLKQHLLSYGGLFLLDGLDEVPETEQVRPQIKQIVEDLRNLFPQCRILVTSRTYAYQEKDWKLEHFTETRLSTFTEAQIQAFITRWYTFISQSCGMNAQEYLARADELYAQILRNPRLKELAERPILLTLMTSLHASHNLPEKRVELYQETVKLLLKRWEWEKVTRITAQGKIVTERQSLLQLLDTDQDKILALLGRLAYQAHASQLVEQKEADYKEAAYIDGLQLICGLRKLAKGKDSQILGEQIEQYLQNRAGILTSPDTGIYTFPHRSFQEYLAACYLTDQDDYPDNIAELARQDPNRWREVLLLAAAHASNVAPMIWSLTDALCFEEPSENAGGAEAWGALLAAQAIWESADLSRISPRNQAKLERVCRWLAAILTEQAPAHAPFPAVERALAGSILARFGDPRPGVGLRNDGLPDIEWREVPAGSFLMGSDPKLDPLAYNSEMPQHQVTLSAFKMSRYPVTNAQYQAFVTDGGPEPYNREPFGLSNHPAVGVSWHDAMAFCEWLTAQLRKAGELEATEVVRLPSEAEWEKAARGTDGRIYPWGNEIDPERANYSETGLGATSAVGCFPRGASPCKCEEMSGNVWEWCWDWFDKNYYANSPQENPRGPESGSNRVFRGGGWGFAAERCRAANRNNVAPGSRGNGLGFRLVRTPL